MSLVYKNSVRENVTDIQTFIVDESAKSTKYFRVSDVPQVLQKGKNLLRITAHPTNLVPDTKIYVDVRDSNGNAIYYEIPDYLENDKSRVISIWIYHDKGDDNTPNGEAIITLAGIANVDLNGNPLPSIHRNKINVKWQTTVTVDRERDNTSQIIFKDDILPIVAVSQSVEQYENQPQSNGELVKTTQTGKVKYLFSGTTPIVQTNDGTSFNSEMVGGEILLNNFTEPALPKATIENPLSSTFFSSSIKEILNGNTLKPTTNFTSSFQDREDLIHTYEFIKEANYTIEYIQSGSNVSTQNKRNFANLSFSNVEPITGLVNKIKVLQKSDGLPGDFELVNEVDVPFSSSFHIKVPIPSKNLKDPKILKLLYLNAEGSISRTETISEPFVFDGDNIYIGGEENLISGSIFISNTLGSGIEIGGASSGFMRSVGYRGITSASLGKAPGGFVIYSGSGNLKFGEDTLDGVGMEFVGDNDSRHLIFTTAGGGLLDVKTDKFFIGNASSQFISGSDGNIEISSSIFHLNPSANSGAGSLIIGANATILADLTVDNLRTPAQIGGNASTKANSSSSIDSDGFARFVSASIGGWDITTSSIEGGNLIMKPEGILQTRDFASGLKGWKISSEGNGTAEFENVRIRGTLRTTTFEKESVNAVGGQLWVANSTTITGSITATDTTMSVKNASGFSQGEILLIKKVDSSGFQTEYVLLQSASIDGDNSGEDETHGRIMISRAYGSGSQGNFVGDLSSAAQVYEDGQVIVSTGKLNTGYIKMNANPNDTDTPYMDIVERTGSGLYDVALKARLGDLGGLANSSYVFGNSNPGFGLATDNVFLQGGIIATTGSIGGIEMQDGKLFTGAGDYNNSNTGFYVDSGSKFSLANKLSWNPTTSTLTIVGDLNFSDGTSVETAINNVSSGSVARTVELSANKYVITFDANGSEAPSNQTITLTAVPQNFVGNVYYEFYKDGTLQGSRGTTSTFTVNSTLEKPTASTPKSYEVKAFNSASAGSVISADSLTLFGVQPGSDGTDAVTAFLTNEAHTLPLSSSGAIQSYAGANTQMKVFEGITDKTSAYTFTESSPSYITATSSSNTFTIASTTTPHSGSVTITAASGSVSLSKIMSVGITRQGDDGTDGTPGVNGDNAKTLIASVDSQVFAFDDSTDNSATPGSITFAFSQQNLNDKIKSSDITITTADSNAVTNFSFDSNSVGGGTNQKSGIVSGSVSFTGGFSSGGLNGAKSSLPLTISCTNDSLTDSVTVFKVEGGSDGTAGVDAVTAFLTNESHTLPSQNDGTVVSFAGATTDMEVFEGVTNSTSNYVISSSNGAGMTAADSGKTVTISGMTHDSGSVTITATSASVSLSKVMTLSKSKQGTAGLPGAAAKLLTLTSDSQIFAFPSASSSTPEDNDILIIVNQQNLSGTIDAGDITIKDSGGNALTDPTFVADVTSGTGQVSGSITFNSTLSSTKTKLPLTIEVAKDGLEDSLKIFKIDGGNEGEDGADAVTAFLTNESHTFAADATGAIAVFTGGATDMEVFEGITNSTSNYVISSSNGIGVTAADSGKTVTISAMAHDSGSVTVNASSGSVSINKIMSLTKARQGVDGGDGTSAKLLIGSLDSQVMAFDDSSDTTATPTSVEFSFQQQNLSGSAGYLTLQSSDFTIALNGGGNITNFDFDNNNVANGTGIVSGSISFLGNTNAGGMGGDKAKFPVTIAATKDGLNDTVKIFKVEGGSDGTDSVQVILSNESHTLAAQPNGTVISFTGADTDVTVFEGITDKTSAYTISRTNGTGVSTNLIGDSGTYSVGDSNANVDVTGMTSDSGSVTINAASGSVSINKIMSLTKAKQGQDGDKFADTSITTTINLTTLSADDTLTFTADTGLAWTAGLTAVLSKDSSNFINGTVNSYNSANGAMSLNVDTITGGGQYTAWSLNVGGVAGPQGLSGANAKNIVASVDSQVFSFLSASDNTAEPTSVIFSFNQQNLNNATIGSSDVTITGADGTNITGFAFNNTNVNSDFSGIASGSLSFSAATSAGGLGSDKDKLPVTISATKDSLTDSIKVFKVEGGTAGSDGTDAVTAFLTNEAHTFAAANNGNIVSFNGAFTDMEVFQGITNVTSNYVISSSNGVDVTATDSGKRVTITALSSDSGSVNITATSGSTSLSKTMSLVKSKQGAQGLAGDDAKMLTITSDSPVFSFASSSSSTALDNTIELVINQQNLSATIDTNDLVIKDAGGNTLTNPTLAPSSLTNNTGLVSGSITFGPAGSPGGGGTVNGDKTKLPLEITITQDGLTDSLKIFKVEGGTSGTDGTDAVNAFLTNESHTFPADSAGAVASFAGGSTKIDIFEGVTDATDNYALSGTGSLGVTFTKSTDTFNITAMGHDSGSLTITAVSSSTSLVKTMSLTKARQGSDGSDGTSAKLLIGSLSSPVFTFLSASDSTAEPLSIEFSFQQQNLSGSAGYKTIQSSNIDVRDSANTQLTGFGFDNNNVSNGTGIVSGSITFASATNAGGVGGDKAKLPITITANVSGHGLSDSVTISKIEGGAVGTDGTSAITALLTNDSHTLPVSSSGNVISFGGASTDILVFQGTSDVTNKYLINTGSVSSHITTTTSGDTVTITQADAPFSGSVVVTATSGSTVLSKTMSISQALQGDDGTDGTPGVNAKTITISSDTQTFAFDDSSDTTATPTSVVFSINQQNLSGAIAGTDITITKTGGGTINTPTISGTVTNGTGTRTFTLPFSSLAKSDLPLSVSVTKDSVTDSTSIIKVEGGANGVSALQYLLTNEAHIVPATSAGVVSSYSNSGTEIYVYEGTTELDYDASGTTAAHWKVGTPTVSPTNKITVGTITEDGNYAVVGNHSSMDNSTDSVTISYPISGKTADGTNFSFTKTQNITKSKEGSDGLPGTSASLISLTGDSQVFAFASASATTPDPTTIELFITQQNLGKTLTASDITIVDVLGNNITTIPTFSPTSLSNNSGVISGSLVFSTLNLPKAKYPITITATSESLSDSFKVFALDGGADGTAGADAYTVFLTNESHTFPAAFNGDVDSSNLAAGATEVRVFKGTTQLTNDNSSPYGANTYRAAKTNSGITLSPSVSNSQRKFTPTAVTADSGTGTITITDNTTGTAFTKTYSFSKSKEGAEGAEGSDSKTVALTAATNVVTYNAAGGSPSPSSTIALSANSQNFTDGYFKFTGDGLTNDTSYTNGASANGDTANFTVPSSYFSSPKTIRVGVADGNQTELAFDTVTIVAVQPGSDGDAGADAVTAFLTSEADVIPAAANGTVSSFAGSGTTMAVFEGITDKTSAYTYTLINTTTGLTAALSTNVLSISGLTPDSGSTDIRATSGSVTLEKTYSIGKSKAGATGADNQDFSYLDASLTGIGPIGTPGLLMNSQVFGFHTGISGNNGALTDFTSFLDSGGNFYLGGNASGASGSDSGYLAWNNTDRSLLISGSKAQVNVDKFFLGNTNTQFISGSNGNITISGDVNFEGKNSNGATVFYDDFAQYAAASDVFVNSNSPQVDGSGVGYYNYGSAAQQSLLTSQGEFSGKVAKFGDNSGNDEVWLNSNKLIPFNENSLYEIEVRFKFTHGGGRVFAGITAYKSDGTTKVNVHGSNDFGSQHYFAAGGLYKSATGEGWVIYRGFFKGTASSGNGGQHNSDTDPGTIHSDAINGYITPMFLSHFDNTPGILYLDYIKLTEVGGGGSTKISGDSITTGTIKSNNLTTDTGTSLGLNDGVMKIGGTNAYTSENGILLDGPNAKFAVGIDSGNYMRFNHTAGKLEINTPNFTIDNGDSVVIQGDLSVVQPDGTVVNLGVDPSEELFNVMIPPSTGQDDGAGRPVDFFSAYGTSATDIFTFTDLSDGNGNVLDIYKSGQQNLGVATKAVAVDSNKYKIRLTLKGGTSSSQSTTSGLYLRIYESNSQLGTSDKFVTLSSKANSTNSEPGYVAGGSTHWTDTGFSGASWYRVSGSAGVGQGENGDRVNLSGTYWPTKYTTFETIYTPTNTAAAFSLNILNWSGNGTEHGYIKDIAIIPIRRASVITGDNIKTGKLESTNLSPGEGSVLDLNSGSMKMGGTSNPGFEVTKEGFVTATNLTEKFVIVTDTNSGSFFENYVTGSGSTNNGTRLLLDGSGGGNVTMNLTLESAPQYIISDIKFPSNVTSDAISDMELKISTDTLIQFDDGAITSGLLSYTGNLLTQFLIKQQI